MFSPLSFPRTVAPLCFCALLLAPAVAQALFTVEQLTNDATGAACGSYLADASSTGDDVAFESDCDLDAKNLDGSFEVYRVHRGQAPKQLSDGAGCTSSSATINGDGSRIAFESDCNLTGGNADGNVEIFLWKGSVLTQLTSSSACENLAPSIDSAGNVIAFDSNCIYAGQFNDDGSTEIFKVTATGALTQLTRDDTGICDSINASINGAGTLVAFESDCDLKGTNDDFAVEIFTVTAAGEVTQATISLDDSCSSMSASIDAAGSLIAFQSDCDFTGANADRSQEAFLVDVSGIVTQLSSDPGPSPCSSSRPRLAGSGALVSFSSYCDLAGINADASLEIFQAATTGQAPAQLTTGTSCDSLVGDSSTSGRDIAFDSDCDPLATNTDGGTEIFRLNACACGSPSSRRTPPTASDALFVLRAAVGQRVCPLCECDTDSSGAIVASDALRVLQAAVGLQVSLTCPPA